MLPSGMAVQGTPTVSGGQTTGTLSCAGPASSALAALTAMLNEAGYETKWELTGTDDLNRTATLVGSTASSELRATIDDADGMCQQVRFTYTD